MSDVLANFEAIESNGSNTHTLRLKSRKLVITNDSSGSSLGFKLNESESFGTLKPTEQISMYVTTRQVIIQAGGGVNYRIWSWG